jgi:hypothetical protein
MNKRGLPFVDDLSGPVLSRYQGPFVAGAMIMVGQTLLLRYADLSYVDPDAEEASGGDRNGFFERVGALPPVDERRHKILEDAGPSGALRIIRDSAGTGAWRI